MDKRQPLIPAPSQISADTEPYIFTRVEDLFDFWPVMNTPEDIRAYLAEEARIEAERAAMILDEEERECHDCGAMEGQLHMLGCDMERCPLCAGQLISCGCVAKLLAPKIRRQPKSRQRQVALEALERAGRVPYISYPTLCARCGSRSPEVYRTVANARVWDRYVQRDQADALLCTPCWDRIRLVVDSRSGRPSTVQVEVQS